jgi:hypothetical protein
MGCSFVPSPAGDLAFQILSNCEIWDTSFLVLHFTSISRFTACSAIHSLIKTIIHTRELMLATRYVLQDAIRQESCLDVQ